MAKFGLKALKRFLNDSEIPLCLISAKSRQKALDSSLNSSALDSKLDISSLNITRVAGFWAAKEACAKALGCGIGSKLSFLDILLSKDTSGAPLIALNPNKLAQFNNPTLYLSISHDSGFAIAVVCVSNKL